MTTQHATPDQLAPCADLCAANLLIGGMPGQGKTYATRTVLCSADPADGELTDAVNRTLSGLPLRCPNTGIDQCDDGTDCPSC